MHMFHPAALAFSLTLGVAAAASAQPAQAAAAARTDVYHVHFTKAAPGQGAALGKALLTPDPAAPMPGHVLVLRHQEGDEWDYVVIEHLGTKATVDAAPAAAAPGRDLRAWHTDTFASGPAWADFARAMGLDEASASKTTNAVYIVSTHMAVPGHRDQLEQALGQLAAGATSETSPPSVLLQHLEGSAWTFLSLTRYNSWQEVATDRAAAAGVAGTGSAEDGWSQMREHSMAHRDTFAGRLIAK